MKWKIIIGAIVLLPILAHVVYAFVVSLVLLVAVERGIQLLPAGDLVIQVGHPRETPDAQQRLLPAASRDPWTISPKFSPTATPRGPMTDLVSALVNLGFKLAIAEDVARTTLADYPNETDVATLVRHALRASTR